MPLELANFLVKMKIKDGLNLDGGSSATLIGNGKLLNRPRGGIASNFTLFKKGRPVYSAVIFNSVEA